MKFYYVGCGVGLIISSVVFIPLIGLIPVSMANSANSIPEIIHGLKLSGMEAKPVHQVFGLNYEKFNA